VTYEETAETVLVRGPGWVVTMPPDGPTRATDDTKASGVTRQILTATIYLREHWAGAPTAGAPGASAPGGAEFPPGADAPGSPVASATAAPVATALQESLLNLDLEDLQKWAGKTILREALALVQAGIQIEVEAHAGLTLRLVRHEVEARLLSAGGKTSARVLLDQVLTTAPRSLHKRWVVAAILAFQQSRGRTLALANLEVPAEAVGAPRSRQQILEATQELLEGMVTTGLAHPSARMMERLSTLSVSALAVHVPRLARLLRALADEVAKLLARDAAADTARLFDRLCLTSALARALAAAGAQPPVALAGRHRTQYEPAGDLQLAGVGAYPWETASGYKGLTVLLWDCAGQRFLTWTASRPTAVPGGFSLIQSYYNEAPWSGGGAPQQFSRSQFVLRQARVNPLGRLSASASTSVAGLTPTDPGQLQFGSRQFTNWRALFIYALSLYPIGLVEKNPLDRLVVLQPCGWGERSFDELQQRFCWRLHDDEGHALTLTLSWAGVNEDAIEFLEALSPDRDRLTHALVRLAFGSQGVLFEPLSLLSQGTPSSQRVFNPAFDRRLLETRHSGLLERLRQKYGRDRIATIMTTDDEGDADAEEPGFSEGIPPGIQARLCEVERLLLQIAEAGLGRLDDPTRQRFRRLSVELDRAGLQELGRGVGDFAQTAALAPSVLWNGYLCRLHREALSLKLSGQTG
jgi:hypothetical protein